MTTTSPAPSGPPSDKLITRDDLEALFTGAEKSVAEFRIGAEAEKIGVYVDGGAPLQYAGTRGVERIFEYLAAEHGWVPESETAGGPVIALKRDGASITLEPGAQLELSGSPLADVHAIDREMRLHLEELAPVSREIGVVWLGVGFQPFARLEELPWVPKQRYGVMRTYLPARGSRGLDMMQRTATVQANFDYESESDAMTKLAVLLVLSPIVHAMTANAPLYEGRVSRRKSERGDVWLHMDPSRSGLIPRIASRVGSEGLRYDDYIEWALDAGMFLFRRGDTFVKNTGQTFRDFLANGFEGHRATYADWVQHVNSLFPEARLKRTLEARSCDVLPLRLATAVPALLTGIVYDARALSQARELCESLDVAALDRARAEAVTAGLSARVGDRTFQHLAERVFEIASGGLERRAFRDAAGRDERVYLEPLGRLLEHGRTPADDLVDGLAVGAEPERADVIERTRIER